MRQKMFWLDLAVCSLWLFVTLANCCWWALTIHFLMTITVAMRIILSFSLYRREKRSWMPLMVFTGLFAWLSVEGQMMITTGDFTDLPFVVLGINNDYLTLNISKGILLTWLFLVPWAEYVVGLCRKTMTSSTLTWKDALGAILWNDKGAKRYVQLMLAAVCAQYAGLAMDMMMCQFACIVIPSLSFYLIAKHATVYRGTSRENPLIGKLWMMVVAMVLFYFAQRYAGMWRVWMLVASIAMVAYVCWRTFGQQGSAGISLLATLYLGMLLPTMAIGYNQYVCIEYGRRSLHTFEPFISYFHIKDAKTDKIGFRDRYGLLIEPVYESIVQYSRNNSVGIYELRKNGYYKVYNAYSKEMMMSNVSDPKLQESICQFLGEYCDRHDYGCSEMMEIRVTKKHHSGTLLAHIKMTRCGEKSYYDYSNSPYISENTVTLRSGEFATDSIVRYGDTFHVLHYSYDVKRDSTVLYSIDLKTARQSTPQHEELDELAKRIETLLKH